MPRLTKARAKERLQVALDAIPELRGLPRFSREFKTWRRNTRVAIENTFEDSASRVEEFSSTSFIPLVFNVLSDNERNERDAYTSGLESAAAILESMVHEIEEYRDDDNQEPDSPVAPDTPVRTNTNQVFVIHGHDHGARDTVARFLEGFRPRGGDTSGAAGSGPNGDREVRAVCSMRFRSCSVHTGRCRWTP